MLSARMLGHPLVEQTPTNAIPAVTELAAAPETGWTLSIEMRIVWPNVSPITLNRGPEALSIRIVELVPAPNWLGSVFGVPVPTIVKPTPEMVIPEVQVQVPAGI